MKQKILRWIIRQRYLSWIIRKHYCGWILKYCISSIISTAIGIVVLVFLLPIFVHIVSSKGMVHVRYTLSFLPAKIKDKVFEQSNYWLEIHLNNKVYQNGNEVGEVRGKVRENTTSIIFDRIESAFKLRKGSPIEYKKKKCKIDTMPTNVSLDIGISGNISSGVLESVECKKI